MVRGGVATTALAAVGQECLSDRSAVVGQLMDDSVARVVKHQ